MTLLISLAQVVSTNGLATMSFPGDAIDRVEEPVAVGEHHDLARLPVDGELSKHGHLRRIPVVDVVRRELVVPLQLAGVGIERDDRRR